MAGRSKPRRRTRSPSRSHRHRSRSGPAHRRHRKDRDSNDDHHKSQNRTPTAAVSTPPIAVSPSAQHQLQQSDEVVREEHVVDSAETENQRLRSPSHSPSAESQERRASRGRSLSPPRKEEEVELPKERPTEDWICKLCDYTNFTNRLFCWRCKVPYTKLNSSNIPPQPELLMRHVPQDATERELMNSVGVLNLKANFKIRIMRDKNAYQHKGIAFIEFDDLEDSAKVLRLGSCKLRNATIRFCPTKKNNLIKQNDDRPPSYHFTPPKYKDDTELREILTKWYDRFDDLTAAEKKFYTQNMHVMVQSEVPTAVDPSVATAESVNATNVAATAQSATQALKKKLELQKEKQQQSLAAKAAADKKAEAEGVAPSPQPAAVVPSPSATAADAFKKRIEEQKKKKQVDINLPNAQGDVVAKAFESIGTGFSRVTKDVYTVPLSPIVYNAGVIDKLPMLQEWGAVDDVAKVTVSHSLSIRLLEYGVPLTQHGRLGYPRFK